MTTIHVRYEILDDPSTPHPDSPEDAYPWGVRAVGLPGKLSVYGVGDTLDEALLDLSEGIRVALADGPIPGPEELRAALSAAGPARYRGGPAPGSPGGLPGSSGG